MISNPYEVLGLSSNASNDDIKRAYRELSRKYHPDSYVNNPLSELAEEKFKEVQEAYDQIMHEREGSQQGGFGNTGYQNTASSDQESVEMQAVYNFLNNRRYQDAMNVLSRMSNRTARWYYCSAIANAGMANNVQALNDAKRAASMEPGNPEYTNLVSQLQWNGQRYQTRGGGYGGVGGRPSYGTGSFCCDLFILDSCCECMGGDLCSCM